MNGRLGVRIGGVIAVATCALLVACGGGGGGGGGTPPTAAPTQTPVPTPTPIPSATFQAGTDAPMPAITAIPGVPGAGWTPYQIASALQFPVVHGWSGARQAIVILGDATPSPADISTFLAQTGLSSRAGGAMRTVNIDGGVNGSGNTNNDDQEAILDAETALSLAPGAIVEFYAMPDLSEQSFLHAEQHALIDPLKPGVVSESFGGCEPSSVPSDHSTIVTGTTQGIAFTAASGDQGNECYVGSNTYTPGPNNPASDPYVIGVGGNENVNASQTGLGSLLSPAVWNDSYLSGPGASGGGVSALFTLPTYQSGVAGVASPSFRNVPDISMPAEGVAIFYAGAWGQFGGTSWGAPEAAALIAELDEYCSGLPADASPAFFYTAFTRSKGTAYLDVTTGNNRYASSSPYYRATVGYDDASGLGLPMGTSVATKMCPTRAWSYGVRSTPMAMHETLGEARDTEVAAAVKLHRMSDLGARSSSAPVTVSVVLRNTGSLVQNEQTVSAALQAAGFQITQTFQTHMVIQASAPASTVNAYFRTAMHDVYQGRYGQRYANVAPVTAPAAIAPYVDNVLANNLITRHRLSHRIR